MATIQIIKQSKVEQPTESEILYNKVIKAQEAFMKAQKDLKDSSIEGLKDLLKKVPGNKYNLFDNDIFIAFYEDEFDYNTVMVTDVSLESDVISFYLDNGSVEKSSFVSADLLYSIYNSMYVKYAFGKL